MRRTLTRLALAVALLFGTVGCAPVHGGTITVTALMADSAGLFVGNDVGILGVPVGEVTSITPEGPVVRVTMEIDADQPVPADAGAVVVARSVATDRYVELTPVFHSGPRMRDGAVIAQSRTRTPVDFDTVLKALNVFATGIARSPQSRHAVRDIIDSGAAAMQGNGVRLNRTITSLGAAVDAVSSQRGNIRGTLTSLDTLTGALARNQHTVRAFVTQVARASAMLAAERKNFRRALEALRVVIEQVAGFASRNRHGVVRTLDQTSDLMRKLMRHKTSLTEILEVMPLTLQNLQRIYEDGRVRVRVDPAVLTPLKGLVDQLCPKLPQPVCDNLGPSVLDLLTATGGRR